MVFNDRCLYPQTDIYGCLLSPPLRLGEGLGGVFEYLEERVKHNGFEEARCLSFLRIGPIEQRNFQISASPFQGFPKT